jgi:hypothetical protein
MKSTIEQQLQHLGVSADAASSIAHDVRQLDARSLFNELFLCGLWSNVLDEAKPEQLQKLGGTAVQRLLAQGVASGRSNDYVWQFDEIIVNCLISLLCKDRGRKCRDGHQKDEFVVHKMFLRFYL